MLTNIFSIILSAPLLSGNAYLDPGSGSYLLQILLATLLASMFFFRSFWGKILNFFRKGSAVENTAPAENTASVQNTANAETPVEPQEPLEATLPDKPQD